MEERNGWRGDVTVVIQTCDDYKIFWKGWNYTFCNHWDFSIEWPVWFCVEDREPDCIDKNIGVIVTGKGEFSTRLARILEVVDTPYLLYLQEDMWLKEKVDKKLFYNFAALMRHKDVDGIKIHTYPPNEHPHLFPTRYCGHKFLEFPKQSEWIYSHQATFWERDFLLSIQAENEGPLENEVNTSKRMWEKYPDARVLLYHLPWYVLPGVAWQGAMSGYGEQIMYEWACDHAAQKLLAKVG